VSLTAEQADAVAQKGNVLLTACPGSGKTRTLSAKALQELGGVRGSPKKICCITYTNSAAQEIESRLHLEMQDGDDLHLTVSTIHSFCLQEVLRPYGWLLPDFQGDLRILTRDKPEFEDIVAFAAQKAGIGSLRPADYEDVESLVVDANRQIVGAAAQNALVCQLAPHFWARCAELGFVDFGSLLYRSYVILRDHPRVAASLSAKYAWILVDEFQDTTELQIEILRVVHRQERSQFFLVGDLAQSIFAFAGARPELLVPFGREIHANLDLSLSENFRSSEHIVSQAEALFPRLPPMRATGVCRLFPVQPKLIRGSSVLEALTDHFLPELYRCGISLGNATVLGRAWRPLMELGRQLRALQIPVVGPGARPYRRSRVFAELAEQLCGAIVSPHPESMKHLQRAVFHTVQHLTGHARMDIFSHEGRLVVIRLLRAANDFARLYGGVAWLDGMSERAGAILVDSGFLDAAEAALLWASVQEMKADMVRQNIDFAAITIDDIGLFANPRLALRLSTIHHAKGREYEAVALVGLREGAFPDFRSTSDEELVVERRLFYVGVTRAAKLLMYVAEANRWNNPPSRFLGPAGVNVL
jgi:DNA helicase-2/ATP-dependent DNA helicase PcrA